MLNVGKSSEKNDDKSAVAMLKKNELHCRTGQLVVGRDKSHERSGDPISTVTPVTSQITDVLGADHRIHDSWGASLRNGAAEIFVNLTEELRHAETNPMCSIH